MSAGYILLLAAGLYALARCIDLIAAHLRRTDPWSPTA